MPAPMALSISATESFLSTLVWVLRNGGFKLGSVGGRDEDAKIVDMDIHIHFTPTILDYGLTLSSYKYKTFLFGDDTPFFK